MEKLYVDDEKPTEEELQEFTHMVTTWVDLDKNVKLLSIAIRERRKAQSVLSPKIQEFMIKYKYDNLNTQQGVIHSSVRKIKPPLKIADVKNKVTQECGEDVAQRIFAVAGDPKEKRTLVRKVQKVSMDLNV